MAHAFDGHSFEQLLGDIEGLVSRARDHEHRLTALVSLSATDGPPAPTLTAASTAPANPLDIAPPPIIGAQADLLSMLREVCVAARDQRQRAETILTRLVGELVHVHSGSRPLARALVVDDSPDNRELAAAVLDASGFHTITATNGLEAVLVAHYARPLVVLMDLTMPVLDGIEAARLLKASAVTRHLKVIAFTARPDSSNGDLASLFADVLAKPASPEAIVAVVRRWAAAR